MAEPRTFKLDSPHMHGDDVGEWQDTLLAQFKTWGVDYPLTRDEDYGSATRAATSSVLHGLGIDQDTIADGVTPWLRVKVRDKRLSDEERVRFHDREPWRKRLAKLHEHGGKVSTPIGTILADSWGWHPPGHDGVDLMCRPNATLLAICDGKVIRADSGGWWGKGAPSPAVAAKGDGIIVVRCTITAGPFKPGLNFCYGHAEHPCVKVGEPVQAGDPIGKAGNANGWHTHFMVNARKDNRGVGDRDPLPFVRYAQTND